MLKTIGAWLVVGLAITAIAGGLGLFKLNEFKAASAAALSSPEPVEAVSTVRARQGQWSASARAIGTVASIRQIDIRNETAGTISEMGFTSGAIVDQGQLLVQLDVRQERASLAATEAEAQLAKQTLERRESLRGSPAFSAQEVDKFRSELAAATSRGRSLEVAIEKKRIVAPFRARIGITDLQPGAYLDVGTLVGRLQGLDDDVFVDFSLPQDTAAFIRIGTVVTLTGVVLPSGSAKAQIVAEDDSIDNANRAVKFRAVSRGLGSILRPGTFVDVTVITSEPQAMVMVPLTAVRRSPNGQHVFVIDDDQGVQRARQRIIKTGPVQNDDIAIETGLAVGDLIASSGSFKLRDGMRVQTDPPQASNGTPSVN